MIVRYESNGKWFFQEGELTTEANRDLYWSNPDLYVFDAEGNAVERPPYIPTLDELKQAKLWALQTHGQAEIANGYVDTTESVTLAMQEKDQNQFSNDLIGWQNAQNVGTVDDTTQVVFLDINGAPHSKTLLQYKQILARYFVYVRTLWATLGALEAQIKAASTQEELDAIVF